MSLSPLDDYPVHQVAHPMRRVGTGDRNFYDRYYFNLHALDEDVSLIAGFGTYPNLGTFDAFATIVVGDEQTVVRASRELGMDRMDTSVGPLRVEVLEGLKKLRVVLEPNEWDFSFDLTFTGTVPAHEEPRHFWRQRERVVFDTCRLAQTGRWEGTIDVGGRRFEVEPQRWWGCRDRSWGVRPVGEPEPPGILASQPVSMLWNYAQIQFDDHALIYMAHENRDGSRVLEESVRVWNDPGRPVERLGSPRHELTFAPGTRTCEQAVIDFGEVDGEPIVVQVKAGRPIHLALGTGYGRDPDWMHGMYQGPLKVEGLHFDLADPVTEKQLTGIVDMVGVFRYGDRTGYGLWEYMVVGPHDQYGFQDWTDGYRPRPS
ncbi:MAG: hypothetical protein QOE54_2254 [Streptosporangiaceae bacterium]|jgi:hypothetical protein|nr:hypothetical protein [Streptosporangiaceae bacterium]